MFAVCKAMNQTNEPSEQDVNLARIIVWYWSKIKRPVIRAVTKNEDVVTKESYTDADFAADTSVRKSIAGEILLFHEMSVR